MMTITGKSDSALESVFLLLLDDSYVNDKLAKYIIKTVNEVNIATKV